MASSTAASDDEDSDGEGSGVEWVWNWSKKSKQLPLGNSDARKAHETCPRKWLNSGR